MSFEDLFNSNKDRGVSPVIATILMVAVVVVIAASIGATVMNTADGVSDPTPQVKFDVEETSDGVKITHTNGDSVDGDQIKLAGAAVNEKVSEWEDETVSVGDSATVDTKEGELKVIWEGESGDSSSKLTSADVSDTIARHIVNQVSDGGQWDDNVNVDMGKVTNIENENVYLEYTNSGAGKMLEDGESESFNKPGSPSHGYSETHTFEMYETADKNNKLCSFSLSRSCWSCTVTISDKCS